MKKQFLILLALVLLSVQASAASNFLPDLTKGKWTTDHLAFNYTGDIDNEKNSTHPLKDLMHYLIGSRGLECTKSGYCKANPQDSKVILTGEIKENQLELVGYADGGLTVHQNWTVINSKKVFVYYSIESQRGNEYVETDLLQQVAQ